MDNQCSCGDDCEKCEECGFPYCECKCETDKDEEDDGSDW